MTTLLRRLRAATAPSEREKGMSLVELIVYSVLLVIVLMIIGSLLIRTLMTQRDVRGRAEASNDAQLTFSALERSLRNAGGGVIGLGGDLLVVRERVAQAADDADHWRCVGYYVDDTNEVVRRVQDGDSSRTKPVVDGADRSLAETWPVVMDRAGAIGSSPGFTSTDSPLSRDSVVEIALRAEAGPESKPVELRSSVTLRPQGGSTLTCY